MTVEELIKRLSVRIEEKKLDGADNDILGSGILWTPCTDDRYSYIFTAAHVVYEKKYIIVRYLNERQIETTVSVNLNDIAIHPDFENSDDSEMLINDVAILRCSRLTNDELKYNLMKVINLEHGARIIFRGFPEAIDGISFSLSGRTIKGNYMDYDRTKKLFSYSIGEGTNLNPVDRNKELVGISGSGVLLYDENNIFLLGIHSCGAGEDSALGTLIGMSSELIGEIFENKGWDKPYFDSDIVGELSDSAEFFFNEIENQELREVMEDLISHNFVDAMKNGFCGCSLECNQSNTPHRCTHFRGNLLILVCILKYLNQNVDFNNPLLMKNGKYYPVKFICSEGKNVISRLEIQHFIRSLKCDYLMKNNLEDGSLIVWGSQKAVKGDLFCSKEMFKNILKNIAGDLFKDRGFDIKRGLTQPRELSILHINEIIDAAEKDSLNNMSKLIIDFINK
jgi:hypothetical protein